jgi:hypothetical protein
MKAQKKHTKGARSVNNRQGMEMLLFLVVSVIGIYALGNGLTGLFEPGKGIDLLWLAVAVAAMMILFAQMGRVHDTWPCQSGSLEQLVLLTRQQEPAQLSDAQAEEREGKGT